MEIRVGFNTPVGQGISGLGFATGELIQGEAIAGTQVRVFSVELMVKIFYGVVTAIFFVRFLVNIVKLLWKTRAYNNFEYIFEMGSTNSIGSDNVVTLKDAFFLIRHGNDA